MNTFRSLAMIAGLTCASITFAGSAPARYRVTELPAPAQARDGCVSGYAAYAVVARVNDFGIANGTFYCYSVVDPANASLQYKSTMFFVSPWFGAVVLPQENPGAGYTYSINNRGQLFGYEPGPSDTGGLFAARWKVTGGHERLFFDPGCEMIQFQGAVAGTARYTVGWGLRGDSRLPPPVDALCIRQRWLIRDANGVETSGPLDGGPSAMNSSDVAVGNMARAAIRYHVATGEVRVLHAADSATSAMAYDINARNDAAGVVTVNAEPDIYNACDRSTAVRWDASGHEQALPHLPGAVSSRAWAIGHDGEVVVGESGAGAYCPFTDNATERAVLWKQGRAHDLNALIAKHAGITLTYAFGINRHGQITAGGFANDDPETRCPSLDFDPSNGSATLVTTPCRNQRMYLLTPVGR